MFIGKINFKNTAENLAISIVVFLVGAFAGYKASTMANETTLNQLIPTIEKAIDKETIKNEILNKIDLKVDKIKKSDSLNINIIQTPDNKQEPINVILKVKDSVPKKRAKFLKRLFKKKKN